MIIEQTGTGQDRLGSSSSGKHTSKGCILASLTASGSPRSGHEPITTSPGDSEQRIRFADLYE
jgi:hypothetical protein